MEISEHEYKLYAIEKVIKQLIAEIRDTSNCLSDFELGTIGGYEDVLCLLDESIDTLRKRV